MARFIHLFLVEGQFFKKLLTRAFTDELHRHIQLGFESAEFDEIVRKIDDSNRLAHVENENLSPLAHGARLHNELTRFRNRHEITHHVRMRHRHGSASFDLILKNRNHGTRGAQDISKAHSHELRLGFF